MKKLLVSLMCMFSIEAYAQTNIQPGTYVTEEGWGTLAVTKDKNGTTNFDIGAIGANGHSCGIDGTIINNVATVGDEPEMQCVVKFKETPKAINVEPVSDECRSYCGMRASFDGEYLKLASSCLPVNIDRSRKNFKKLYKEKKYEQALAVLEPVFNNCSNTIFWIDSGWIRNDLAVTYAKLQKFDACEKVLAPLKADSKLSKDELEYPPTDAISYWSILQATKTNLKLCNVK